MLRVAWERACVPVLPGCSHAPRLSRTPATQQHIRQHSVKDVYSVVLAASVPARRRRQDSMGDRLLSLLSALQGVLLGDDHDEGARSDCQPSPGTPEAEAGANPQQAILQQLLLACLDDAEAAWEMFSTSGQSASDSTPAVYPLLLASLQEGFLEAAQLLMLAQLLHQQQRRGPSLGAAPAAPATPDADGSSKGGSASVRGSTSTSFNSSSSPAMVWPSMVFNRLVLLATSTQESSTDKAVAVVAMRLLAMACQHTTDFTTMTNENGTTSTHSPASSPPAPLLQLIKQLQTSLETAASQAGSSSPMTDADGWDCVWPFTLGPDGVAGAAHLITSLTASTPAPPTKAATSTAAHHTSAATGAGSTTSSSKPTPAAAAALTPSLAVCLLLKLFQGLQAQQHSAHTHPGGTFPPSRTTEAQARTTATTASSLSATEGVSPSGGPGWQAGHTSWGAALMGHATSRGLPAVGLQLQMLTGIGDGQAAHVVAEGMAAAAAAAGGGGGGGSSAGGGVHAGAEAGAATAAAVGKLFAGGACRGACCAACCEVLRCIAVVVLRDATGAAATQREVLQELLQCLRSIIISSPKVTTQQLDWSGKPTGFALSPCAAPACRAKTPGSSSPATAATTAAAAAAASAAAAAAAGASEGLSLLSGFATLEPAWAAAGVSEAYSTWLQGWGLAGQAGTVLEAVLLLLLAMCQAGSWGVAAVLYGSDVSSVLEQLCGFVDPGVQALLQRVYRCLCVHSGQLRDEVMQDSRVQALQALIAAPATLPLRATTALPTTAAVGPQLPAVAPAPATAAAGPTAAAVGTVSLAAPPAVPPRLQAAAMSRLASLLDGAAGSDFLAFTGASTARAAQPGKSLGSGLRPCAAATAAHGNSGASNGDSSSSSGSLSSVIALLLQSMPGVAGGSAGGTGVGSPAAADASAAPATAAAGSTLQAGPRRQHDAALLRDARQVYLLCLNRARQMQHLTPQQLPRGGVWSATSSSSLRQLEAYCLKPLSTPDGMAAATAADGAAGSASISNAAAAAIGGDGSRSSSTAASSSGKRRAGNSAAVSGTVGPGHNAAGGGAAASGAAEAAYDEDGLREVWSSGPSAATLAARSAWKQLSLHEALAWTQSSSDIEMKLLLPAGTRKQDVVVSIQPGRLTVRLHWYGRVLDGPLKKRVKPGESCWSLGSTRVDLGAIRRATSAEALSRQQQQQGAEGAAAAAATGAGPVGCVSSGSSNSGSGSSGGSGSSSSNGEGVVEMRELLLVLPKEEAGRYWRALFEGGEEKSHMQVLQEALSNEDDARHGPGVDQLGPEAAALLEELRERQELMVSGQWSIEHSFDDFRLVLGDSMM